MRAFVCMRENVSLYAQWYACVRARGVCMCVTTFAVTVHVITLGMYVRAWQLHACVFETTLAIATPYSYTLP